MATIIRREVRKRGFFGWLFLLLFFAFNALMVIWLLSYWSHLGAMHTASEAERTGVAIGGTIGSGLIFIVWVGGAVILGLFALLTRGRKTIIEES